MKYLTRIIPLLALLLTLGMAHMAHAQVPAPVPAAPAAPAATPIVRTVEVRGFQHVSSAIQQQVLTIVNALANQPYDKDKTDKAVAQIQDLGSFANASVSQEAVANGVKLVFTVSEYRVVDQIRFVGNTVFTDEQLSAVIKSKPGEVLNQNQASNDAIAIRETYTKAGYTLSEVIDVRIETDPTTQKSTLIFEIFEPRISEIRIVGATRTREYVIRRQLDFKVGDVYNAKKISNSLLNLNQLGIFQDVTATPETGVQVGTVRVNINIVEKRTGTAAIGVAQSSGANNAGLSGFISLSDTNLMGSGQRLSLSLRFGAENSYELSYTNPWIDHHRTSATFNVYNRSIVRQAFLGNLSPSTFNYDEERRGGDITVGRPISGNTRLFLGFRANDISGKANDQAALDALLND
ncbi:MAG TPA: POTRA domain-containing protein, partial [Armatimonadota bacterium]